ncbi:7084_t:CDS:10 [Entrophospora sp. SA101]|nr:7084_t:CDS:10 [Entrophospora sp. SA101]
MLEEEIETKDENGSSTFETEETEIEVGEFLQFFWQKKESGQLASYDGDFESPRIPKEAEVLDDNLPNLAEMANVLAKSSNALITSLEILNQRMQELKQQVQISMSGQNSGVQAEIIQLRKNTTTIVATVAVGIATGGTSLVVQAAAIGGVYLVGSAIDDDRKKRENENKQLNLKGEITKQIRDEINNLQDERNQKASQLNTLEQHLAQKQNKLNDPNTPEHEKAQIRSEITSFVSQIDKLKKEINGYDDKINGLIKQSGKTITGGTGLANIELDYNTKQQRDLEGKNGFPDPAEVRKEEAEKRKKAKELKDSCNNDLGTVYCRYCSAKTELFDVCDKQECLAKMNKAIENKKETNPNQNQAELESKKKKLAELENKQKQLDQQLPLTTQITILAREIKDLENKSNRTQVEEALLTSKKKELAELLRKQDGSSTSDSSKSSDKTALAVGYEQVKEWLGVSLKAKDASYAKWLRDELQFDSKRTSEHDDLVLRKQYSKHLENFSKVYEKDSVDESSIEFIPAQTDFTFSLSSSSNFQQSRTKTEKTPSIPSFRFKAEEEGKYTSKKKEIISECSLSSEAKEQKKLAVNAQEYLDQNYPEEKRDEIKELCISFFDYKKNDSEKLKGFLSLSRFANLEKFNCCFNEIISLNIANCPKLREINCRDNKLRELKLHKYLSDNNFPSDDLSIFKRFTNLKSLGISNTEKKVSNNFYGSLKFLESLNSLESLDISGTNVCTGLEHLPKSTNLTKIDLSDCSELIEIWCSENMLEEIMLPKYSSNLKELKLNDNNFPKQVGNSDEKRIKKGTYNKFYGSLKYLKRFDKLECLDISNTDIDSGLEHLPIGFSAEVTGGIMAFAISDNPYLELEENVNSEIIQEFVAETEDLKSDYQEALKIIFQDLNMLSKTPTACQEVNKAFLELLNATSNLPKNITAYNANFSTAEQGARKEMFKHNYQHKIYHEDQIEVSDSESVTSSNNQATIEEQHETQFTSPQNEFSTSKNGSQKLETLIEILPKNNN